MKITRKIIFRAKLILVSLSVAIIYNIHPAENKYSKYSPLNRVTIHYHPSVVHEFPLAIKFTTLKWNKKLHMIQAVSKIDPRSSSPIKNYLMRKENGTSSSLFAVHVPWSDKKDKLITAEDGDHFFISYKANGEECYLSIGKESPKKCFADYEFDKIVFLTIPRKD